MFPTIHKYDGMDLTTQGYGSLSDCISCEVTEELNGAFTLELTYPLNGLHSEYLVTGNIIVAKPNHNQSKQPFRITEVKKSFANNIQVYANHICYDLSGFPVRAAYSYNNLTAVLAGMNDISTNMQLQAYPLSAQFHAFEFSTDMTSSKTFSMEALQTLRAWMGGQDGSILDVYGGEWVYDNFSCFLTSRRGQDTGYRISYGKNLAEYEKDRNYTEYSHACAYWKKSDVVVYSDITPTGIDCAFRCGYIDATSAFDSQPSVAQLNSYVSGEIATMVFGAQTITVTPAQLGNDVIGLGDGVLVCYESVFSTRVIKTVWDVLTGTYKTLQLGTKRANITDTIKSLSTGSGGVSGSSAPVEIIEEGITGAWYARKWANGWLEMWIENFDLGSTAITSSYGNGYFTNKPSASTYYSFGTDYGSFISPPALYCSLKSDNGTGLIGVTPRYINTNNYQIFLWSFSSISFSHLYLNVYACGRWK